MPTIREYLEEAVNDNPKVMVAVRCPHTKAVAFIDLDKYTVNGFRGKRGTKSDYFIRCGSVEQAKTKASEFIDVEIEKYKNNQARKTTNSFVVDDILVARWGSDQTNIDYYQVLKTTSKSIQIQKIESEKSNTDVMHGKCIPLPGKFTEKSEPMMRRVNEDYVFINAYTIARKLKAIATLPSNTKVYKSASWSATA